MLGRASACCSFFTHYFPLINSLPWFALELGVSHSTEPGVTLPCPASAAGAGLQPRAATPRLIAGVFPVRVCSAKKKKQPGMSGCPISCSATARFCDKIKAAPSQLCLLLWPTLFLAGHRRVRAWGQPREVTHGLGEHPLPRYPPHPTGAAG